MCEKMVNYILKICRDLVDQLFSYALNKETEICGILIGRKIDELNFLITHIVYDNNPISQNRYSVIRNTINLHPKVKNITENWRSERVDFIGDWHSHLNHSTNYSSKDFDSMKKMLKDRDYSFLNEIILLIISVPKMIKAYLFSRTDENPENMEIVIIEKN